MRFAVLFTLVLGLFACTGLVQAQQTNSATPAKEYSPQREFITVCFTFGIPTSAEKVVTNGIKVGAPISAGAPVNGLEASVFCSNSVEVTGVQCSIITNVGKKVSGLQFGILNFVDVCDGLQLGIFNDATQDAFQIGILNHIEGASIPWLPLFNVKF